MEFLTNIIAPPFAWLLSLLYNWTENYGISIILFAVAVQLVLLPITAKSKKGMMKMSRLQPRIQEIQQKYANDQAKQQEAMQALQKEEGATMGCGGCLWSFIPMFILLPLYSIIRYPLQHMLGAGEELIEAIGKVGDLASKGVYWQITAADQLFNNPELFEGIEGITETVLNGIDFSFLGLSLGAIPEYNIFGSGWEWNWAHIGLFLIPVISAGSQVLQSLISQKMNNSVITNEKGIQDKEVAQKSQSNQTMKIMIYMMPLMSLVIGFTVPAALSIYWLVGGVIRTIEDIILTKHYRKKYDAEDMERLAKYQAQLDAEAEKERIRAEKRAANPDGITENTSKKKQQKKQKAEEAAAKAAAAKEYAAKKGVMEEEKPANETLSGVKDRPNCKGRNYDPNRYTEEEK